MPEGHTIHRLAAQLTDTFGGQRVAVTSPQGRFSGATELLNGHELVEADAYGKHLFIVFDAPMAEPIIHVHLGLIGKFRLNPPAPPVGQIRLRIANSVCAADLSGPQTCRLITPAELDDVVAALGADPLRADTDPEVAWRRIHASAKPIAALLMDQRVTAGVGNIYRAEVLYRARVNPMTPGNQLRRSSWQTMWNDLVELMAYGVRTGHIDTVRHEDSPEMTGRDPRVDRHGGEVYVYRRADLPCHVCGSRVRHTMLEGRNLYWCGRCQRRR